MAWIKQGTVPMFPNVYDLGVGSAIATGDNRKGLWKIKNESTNRPIYVRFAIKKSGTSEFSFAYTPNSEYIAPGGELSVGAVNLNYTAYPIASDSFGVRADAYDDYPYIAVYKDIDTPPTTPSSISVSGTFQTGKILTVSWGTSTDPDGDFVDYSLSYSRNGGAWTALQSGTTARSFTYTIPSGTTSIQFQVVARANGLFSGARTSTNYTVTTNTAPTITATAPSGTYATKPSFNYTVRDTDGHAMTITEAIDGIVFNTRTTVVSGTQLTFTPTDLAWLRTRIKQTVNITITANDGNGGVTTVNYPITRTTPAIDLQLKTPFETDVAAKRLLLKLEGSIPGDAVVNVQACNNAFDANPTWENATNLVLSGFPYPFNNTVKTAVKWGISFKIRIERGSNTQPIYLDGVGGAFD